MNKQKNASLFAVLLRLLKQCYIPIILAFCYTIWDVDSFPKDQADFKNFIKTFSVAFFLIMWFVGQFLRTSKLLHDETKFNDIQSDLSQVVSRLPVLDALKNAKKLEEQDFEESSDE